MQAMDTRIVIMMEGSPSRRQVRGVLAVTGMLILAACSGAGSTPVTDPFATLSSAYDPASVWHVTKDGMRTVIHGNPFDVSQAVANQVILSSLRMPPWHQKAQFVPHPTGSKRRGARLVMIFNPTDRISHGDACGDLSEIGVGPKPGVTRVHAAFCASERSLSHIDGRVTASGPKDPAFRSLMAQAIDQLLPRRNFENDGSCKDPNC